jgi:hypothetical protein
MASEGDKKNDKSKTVNAGEMKGVTIKSTPLIRQDSMAVGSKMQSKVDVAKALGSLKSVTGGGAAGSLNLSGKNDASDNVNAMIERRKRLSGG